MEKDTSPPWFEEHEALDIRRHDSTMSRFKKAEKRQEKTDSRITAIHKRLGDMPTKEDLSELLTKEDAAQILQAIQNIKMGFGFIRISGKTALWITSVGGSLFVIFKWGRLIYSAIGRMHL